MDLEENADFYIEEMLQRYIVIGDHAEIYLTDLYVVQILQRFNCSRRYCYNIITKIPQINVSLNEAWYKHFIYKKSTHGHDSK